MTTRAITASANALQGQHREVLELISNAKRFLPGMFVSVLLAAPAFAPGSAHASTQPRKTHSTEESRRASTSNASARHGRTVASAVRGRRGRQTTVSQTAFVDDGTAWSEPGREVNNGGWHGMVQTGMASWYGGSAWHGHMMSSGERYDQEGLTAAHATLPMGTLVRVSMLDGSSSVVVRITDRPGTRKRVIDLSRAAARELGILNRGVAMVSLEPMS